MGINGVAAGGSGGRSSSLGTDFCLSKFDCLWRFSFSLELCDGFCSVPIPLLCSALESSPEYSINGDVLLL